MEQQSPPRANPAPGYRILLPAQLNISTSESQASPPIPHCQAPPISCPSSLPFPVFHPATPPSPPRATLPSEPLNFGQLYNLALADRMRLLASLPPFNNPFPQFLQPNPPSLPIIPQRFNPPADLSMFPMAKLDPRLFRIPFPEEPKPQHSYIGLIAMAILSSPEKKLVLADIYQYVLDNFPYFRHRGQGWRNSIRHNLSLNDFFLKAGRAANGKGHFWAVHPACVQDFQKGDFRRRRAQRRVRKHLGLHVEEEEDDDSPPPSPIPSPPVSPPASTILTPSLFNIPPESGDDSVPTTDNPITVPQDRVKTFNFGVDFLLGHSAADKKL